jgi:hypothetical protein
VTINVNNSTKCKLGTVTATGTFRMQAGGPGGTVQYHWTRKDGNVTTVSQTYSIVIPAGNTAAHSVVTDSWTPADSGTEQLVFTNPGFAVAPQSWTCRP